MKMNETRPAKLRRLERSPWLPKSAWPFDTSGLDMGDSVVAVSEAGRGAVLLFVHAGTWSFIFRDLVMELAPHFRCVLFDVPGTGQSYGTAADGVSLDLASRATAAVITALGLRELTLVV